MLKVKLTMAFVLPLLFFSVTQGDPVELVYDSGNGAGHFDQATSGDIESVHFTPAHPCTLLSFRFMPINTGEMEWHVWGDNGGNQPDIDNDLVEPVMIDVDLDNSWITVDISDQAPVIDPPAHFHIGYVKQNDEPDLLVDGGDNFEQRSRIRIDDIWYVTADGAGNYLLRATVEYFYEIDPEDYLFTNVNEEAGVRNSSRIAWGDYDNDGWEDMLVNGRILYHNLHNGTFEEVAEDAGIAADNPATPAQSVS